MTQRRWRAWVVLSNAFWIVIWLPGLIEAVRAHDRVRYKDVLAVIALTLGILCDVLEVRPAYVFNVGYYLLYAVVPIVLLAGNPSDMHLQFGVILISIPYIVIGLINLHRYSRPAME